MSDLLVHHPHLLPQIVLLGCFGLALLIAWHVLTDRRRGHLARMESLPLEDGQEERRHG